MRALLWAIGITGVLTCVSVIVEGAEGMSEVPAQYLDSSFEVGFSQDSEPEPHLLAVVEGGEVRLYELPENLQRFDRKPAMAAVAPPQVLSNKAMAVDDYIKSLQRSVEIDRFFSASQVKRRGPCKDEYLLRIRVGSRFRERRGCSHQSNDPFASLAQNIYREAFTALNKRR